MPMAPAKIARNTKKSNGVSSSVSGGTSIHCAAKMTGVTARRAKTPAVGRAPVSAAPVQPEGGRRRVDDVSVMRQAHGQHPARARGIPGERADDDHADRYPRRRVDRAWLGAKLCGVCAR